MYKWQQQQLQHRPPPPPRLHLHQFNSKLGNQLFQSGHLYTRELISAQKTLQINTTTKTYVTYSNSHLAHE